MERAVIVVEVEGGVVTNVVTPSDLDMYCIIRDHDNIEAGDPDPLEDVGDLQEWVDSYPTERSILALPGESEGEPSGSVFSVGAESSESPKTWGVLAGK